MLVRSREIVPRRAAAAVEFACVLPFLLLLILGVWEVARMVQVVQIMTFAAREGARTASQGYILAVTGTYTNIQVSGSTPSVADSVRYYCQGAGLNVPSTGTNAVTDAQLITFQFTNQPTGGAPANDPTQQPYSGVKGQQFQVQVTIPWQNVRWVSAGWFNPTNAVAQANGVMMVDSPVDNSYATMPLWQDPQ